MTTNNPIELFRESSEARRILPFTSGLSHECWSTFDPLRQCLGTKTLAIHIDQSDCDTKEWKANCAGVWRRYFIEQTYRQQVNTIMYKQQDLDAYSKAKNSQQAEW